MIWQYAFKVVTFVLVLFFSGCSVANLDVQVQQDKLHRFVEQMPKVELVS